MARPEQEITQERTAKSGKRAGSKGLLAGILSLSLLTVMAGAAVAPALGVIREYFAASPQVLVQMIISVPALFIIAANFCFPRLSRTFRSRTLVMLGLVLYTAGGCLAGVFNNIYLVLAARALVGLGVGVIMPLSTGLLTYYFPPQKQAMLLGLSSAMNQLGGVIATLLSGLLANISWRASFLVYLMGLFSIVLCLIFLPNEELGGEKKKSPGRMRGLRKNFIYVVAMFLLMATFFVYPSNFAMETIADVAIPRHYIAVIMAGMDLVAFLGGLAFASLRRLCGLQLRFLAPALFLGGYILLVCGGVWPVLIGSALVGFANGAGVPFIIHTASRGQGREAVTTVMPLLSAALYLAQFLSPLMVSAVVRVWGSTTHISYICGAVLAALFCVWSLLLRERPQQESRQQERL